MTYQDFDRDRIAVPERPPVRRYRSTPRQPSTKALTARFAVLATIATLAIGGLLAAQMASRNDPALGPKARDQLASKSSSGSSGTSSSTQLYPYSSHGDQRGSYGSSGYDSSSSDGYAYSGQPAQTPSPPVVTGSS